MVNLWAISQTSSEMLQGVLRRVELAASNKPQVYHLWWYASRSSPRTSNVPGRQGAVVSPCNDYLATSRSYTTAIFSLLTWKVQYIHFSRKDVRTTCQIEQCRKRQSEKNIIWFGRWHAQHSKVFGCPIDRPERQDDFISILGLSQTLWKRKIAPRHH